MTSTLVAATHLTTHPRRARKLDDDSSLVDLLPFKTSIAHKTRPHSCQAAVKGILR